MISEDRALTIAAELTLEVANKLETLDDLIIATKAITVKTSEDNRVANAIRQKVNTTIKKIDAEARPEIDKANVEHKKLTAALANELKPFQDLSKILKEKMEAWAEADALRIRKEKDEDARKKKEEADEKEKARMQWLADQRAAAGATTEEVSKIEEAAAVVNTPVIPVVVTAKPEVESAHDQTLSWPWVFEVIDFDKIPREYLMIDEKLLLDIAKATKGEKQIDGIRFYQKAKISTRTK